MVSLRSDLAETSRGSSTEVTRRRTSARAFRSLFVLLLAFLAIPLRAADNDALLNSFLEGQKKVQTWSAEFVQTRTMKSFAKPLTATGHVWFSAPNRFHWELGQPPQTIAVRGQNE